MGKKQKKPTEPPRFSVESQINVKVQKEITAALAPVRSRIIGYLLIGVLLGAMLLFLDRYIESGGMGDILVCLLSLAGLLYMLYAYAIKPVIYLRRWEKAVVLAYGVKVAHLTTEFYEQSLAQTLQEDGTLTLQDYAGLTELRQTAHLYLLRTDKQQWFFVSKDGFTTGDPADFPAFINARIQKN